MEKTGLAYQLLAFFTALAGWKAYALILGVLLACGFGLPIPEDITLIAAGILAGTGKISIAGAYIAGFVGVLAGDSLLFLIGRKYGRRVFEFPIFKKFFTPKMIAKAEAKIQENARMVCFIARFLPGLRAPVYLTSGVLGVRPIVFFMQDGLAALISVPIWIYLGQWAVTNMDKALEKAKEFHVYLLIGIGALILFWIAKSYLKKKKEKLSEA